MLAYYMNSAELQRWISTLKHPGNMVIMKYSHNTTQNGGRLHEEHYAASSKRDTDICGRGLPYKKNEELQKVHSRSNAVPLKQELITGSLHTNCNFGSTLSRIFLFLEL